MSRADNIRADLARIGGMSDAEFEQQWGEWCRRHDRDIALMRQRWLRDLDHMLWHAQQEESACVELVAAKDAYREDPSAGNRTRRDEAIARVRDIRAAERSNRGDGHRIAGDAFVTGSGR